MYKRQVLEDVFRYFQLPATCESQLISTCDTTIFSGTYAMAEALADTGTATGIVRIDARWVNGEWIQQFNGGATVPELASVQPNPDNAISIAYDLATKAIRTVPLADRLPVLCGCEFEDIVTDDPTATSTINPPSACGQDGVYVEPAGEEDAACTE